MKLVARFFLFLFIVFLSTPTIISWIENSNDTPMFFSVSEDDNGKKEEKSIIFTEATPTNFKSKTTTIGCLIISKKISIHDNISRKIFSPPPNMMYYI
ncbi:hypothetical protein AAGV28_02065 [Flavobacterium sp. FZUC8N2.13]|uniref:Uncharacterized protein n=1 Tax=Flavobacterium zubiriense TaxID=3138075 RepID=A0ABV4T871_9FLAO